MHNADDDYFYTTWDQGYSDAVTDFPPRTTEGSYWEGYQDGCYDVVSGRGLLTEEGA